MVHPPSLLARRSQQQQAEQEEEYITNRLMKRLAQLKQEKEDLARQVEAVFIARSGYEETSRRASHGA